MSIGHEELKQMLRELRWIDDIPEDQPRRDEICLQGKAALLLEANIDSAMFPNFIRSCERDQSHPDCYCLPEPFSFVLQDQNSPDTIKWTVTGKYFNIVKNNQGRKTLGPAAEYRSNVNSECYLCDCCPESRHSHPSPPFCVGGAPAKKLEAAFYEKYPSLYSLCATITPYANPAQMCRFWGQSSDPFAKFKVRNMRPDYIWSKNQLVKNPEQKEWSEARLEQETFQYLIPCQAVCQQPFALENRYHDTWYCQVFPFRNQYGEEIMKLIKVYDPETQYKYLLPVTTWLRNSCVQSQLFCVPYPMDKTPLYNLDLLLKPECRTVILCDSVELADANQHEHASREIVFTSFLCSPGRYKQVDWSPLVDKEIALLVSNHSGISLESAALKAKALRDFLRDKHDFATDLLAVVPVKYDNRPHRGFRHVDDILMRFEQNRPEVDSDHLEIFETASAIEEVFQKAKAKLNELPDQWWLNSDVPPEEKRIAEEEKNKPQPPDYVMRPILARGEASLLYAQKGVGKSSLAYSIAARVVTQGFSGRPVPLLKEKWWTVPKGQYKVLYLDFENKKEMASKQKSFQDGYFPADEEKKKECRNNLIMLDCSDENVDFSAPGNHQKLLDMLEKAKKQGTPGKSVDLLVIDTYTSFVHDEISPQIPANFKDLLNKIRGMDIAVLVVTHANDEDKVRGFTSKLDPFFIMLKLSSASQKAGSDLTEQARILTYEHPREVMCAELRVPFRIHFDSSTRHWCVGEPKRDENAEKPLPIRDENAELKLIVKDYRKKCKYDRDAICRILGLESSALSARLQKAGENKKAL